MLSFDRGRNLDWYDTDPEEFDDMYYDGTWETCYPDLINLDDIEEAYIEELDDDEKDLFRQDRERD